MRGVISTASPMESKPVDLRRGRALNVSAVGPPANETEEALPNRTVFSFSFPPSPSFFRLLFLSLSAESSLFFSSSDELLPFLPHRLPLFFLFSAFSFSSSSNFSIHSSMHCADPSSRSNAFNIPHSRSGFVTRSKRVALISDASSTCMTLSPVFGHLASCTMNTGFEKLLKSSIIRRGSRPSSPFLWMRRENQPPSRGIRSSVRARTFSSPRTTFLLPRTHSSSQQVQFLIVTENFFLENSCLKCRTPGHCFENASCVCLALSTWPEQASTRLLNCDAIGTALTSIGIRPVSQ
mmetsp:Transcript_55104/g.107765  ORF Transcript_55104/g.107765 Transcript_55104/m.107765 type:complete len:294 (+) Transcript_55104:305-1186(+)